jgi:hypothetical protein
MTGGQFIHPGKGQGSSAGEVETKWNTVGWRRWSLSPIGLAAKKAIEEKTSVAGSPRNFAILRRRYAEKDVDAPLLGS